MKKDSIFQFRIDLRHAKPPIWRRLLIPQTATFGDLHRCIQALFDWDGSHLHAFNRRTDFDYISISVPMMGMEDAMHQEEVQLQRFFNEPGDNMSYVYDFGDNWEHSIKLEKILNREANTVYPRCIKGRCSTPPEDMGGYWGFMQMLEAAQNPKDPNHEEYLEYIEAAGIDPDNYDPKHFDLAEANDALQEYFRKSL